MIRFVDLSHALDPSTDRDPVCAFFDTDDGRFVDSSEGLQEFRCLRDFDHLSEWMRKRLLGLVPAHWGWRVQTYQSATLTIDGVPLGEVSGLSVSGMDRAVPGPETSIQKWSGGVYVETTTELFPPDPPTKPRLTIDPIASRKVAVCRAFEADWHAQIAGKPADPSRIEAAIAKATAVLDANPFAMRPTTHAEVGVITRFVVWRCAKCNVSTKQTGKPCPCGEAHWVGWAHDPATDDDRAAEAEIAKGMPRFCECGEPQVMHRNDVGCLVPGWPTTTTTKVCSCEYMQTGRPPETRRLPDHACPIHAATGP